MSTVFEFGPFRLIPEQRFLLKTGLPRPIALTPKMFEVLTVLVVNHERVVTKEEIIRAAWPESEFVEENNVARHISMVRGVLGSEKQYIQTLPKVGYRFVAPVTVINGLGPELLKKLSDGSAGLSRWKQTRFRVGAALAVLASLGGLTFVLSQPGKSSDVQFLENDLVVSDSGGRETWRYGLPHGSMLQGRYNDLSPSLQRYRFLDLDGDSSEELLVESTPADATARSTSLYCFSPKGKLLWQWELSRPVADARTSFSSVYRGANFAVTNTEQGDGPRIVVTTHHSVHYPNLVAVLDRHGRVEGEYWHSGHLRHLLAADLDGDGIEEAILGGANNGQRRATLVVLDPRHVRGASRQPLGDPHQLQGFAPGTEKAVVLFPRSCVGRHEAFDIVKQIYVSDSRMSIVVAQSVYENVGYYLVFELDWQLNLIGITPSDTFAARHRELEVQGLLDHPFTLGEIDKLKGQYRVVRDNNE